MAYTIKELSPRTLADFEDLAAQQGYCWCMYYQRPRPVGRNLSNVERKAKNRRDKAALVRASRSHAILVYDGEKTVGWCQYGVKDELPRIDAGRNYRKVAPPVEAEKLWRITCFFVDKDYRGKGVAKLALKAALDSIKKQGGGVVEAYPVVSEKMAAVAEWRWFGTPSMFRGEHFRTVAPLGSSGVLMRKTISP
ncbi:GNAT family N-acetyltransferase [Candidatus Bathyarchaeota archaeon]|nr:MAG: GNAT family N-acetyltransferase [Candidatus Bathyarchaeota archaeon]TMI31268.1 MAG: GNAT family N-acetyltransferase [Candidatus Bathyarchaeota archaeon]